MFEKMIGSTNSLLVGKHEHMLMMKISNLSVCVMQPEVTLKKITNGNEKTVEITSGGNLVCEFYRLVYRGRSN